MRVLFALLFVLAPVLAHSEPAAPNGRVLVTLGGDLPAGNLPARDPDAADFFAFLELDYTTGIGFDDAMLAELTQGEITLPAFGVLRNVTFTGPYLASVLDYAGAAGRTARPMALDGYQVDIPWDNIIGLRPILATNANGVPLALGGYGPTAIIYPRQSDAALQEDLDALQVWAIVFIGVE